MGMFGATLAGLAVLAEQDTIVVTTGPHGISPKYHQNDYETACGSTVIQVRYRQGPDESGRVDHLLVNGQPVRHAAERLEIRAARRMITGIEIYDCGRDSTNPVILGMMKLEPMESQRLGMRSSLAFRLTRDGRGSWTMTVDGRPAELRPGEGMCEEGRVGSCP